MILEPGRVIATADIGKLGTLKRIAAPQIAAQARAGQFALVRAGPWFDPPLRRAYSLARVDRRGGEIELLIAPSDRASAWIASRREGDELDLIGPLGSTFVIHRGTRNLLLVTGGTGIAPLRVLAEHEASRRNVTLVMGARAVSHLWPSDRLPATVEYVTTTDDGSFGIRGRVTDALESLLAWADQLCASGPWPLLAALADRREQAARMPAGPGRAALLESQVAVEQRIGCAMGVCRGCVVATSHGNARVCREGPIFTLGDVNFGQVEPATVGSVT